MREIIFIALSPTIKCSCCEYCCQNQNGEIIYIQKNYHHLKEYFLIEMKRFETLIEYWEPCFVRIHFRPTVDNLAIPKR